MSREPVSRLKAVVVAAVALATGVQLFGVTFISLPPAATPPGTRAVSELVLWSYFEEEWKLFAPNPISMNRDLLVQPAWLESDGTVAVGEWVDLTAIDNTIVAHSVGAPRSAYLTARMAGSLDSVWAAVGAKIRTDVADATVETTPLTVEQLASALVSAEVPQWKIDSTTDFDTAAIVYATDVLRSLEPDRELAGVRYGTRMTSVPPWHVRDTGEATTGPTVEGPWRVPATDDPERRESVADFLRRYA